MTVFADYSRYYDLLYQDKDYAAEVDFVERLIWAHRLSASSILELGCGTGRHAELLARRGFKIHGVDLSDGMLAEAEKRRFALTENRDLLSFSCGDLRSVRLSDKFDTVISLFHVASYMTEDADLDQLFSTAKAHLHPGGLFLFDFWYGPAVLHDRPSVRIKRLADDKIEITRIAEPDMRPNENLVNVNYEMHVFNKQNQLFYKINECHRMRYLFKPELLLLFAAHDMKPVFFTEWLTGMDPGFNTWNVCAGGIVEVK